MIDTDYLESEAAIGEQYQRSWDTMVKPFFDEKKAELYQVFLNHPASDKDGLLLLKLQVNALTALEDDFQNHINTGKLARKTLEELNNGH